MESVKSGGVSASGAGCELCDEIGDSFGRLLFGVLYFQFYFEIV